MEVMENEKRVAEEQLAKRLEELERQANSATILANQRPTASSLGSTDSLHQALTPQSGASRNRRHEVKRRAKGHNKFLVSS